jgi:hypothetical protein
MAALLVVLSSLLAASCAALAVAQVRRVARATSTDARALAASLRRVPAEVRAAELARRAPPESWEGRLGVELGEAATDAARVAAVNDALADVARELEAGAGWPAAAVRLAAFGGLLLIALGLLAHAGAVAVTLAAGIGAGGAIVAALAGRRAGSLARAEREAVDALVDALALPAARRGPDAVEPAGRGARRTRRGGARR